MENRIEMLEFDENERETKKPFQITNIDSCNWAFRKLAVVKLKEDDIKMTAEDEIYRITQWKNKELEKLEGEKEFFEGLLQEYFLKEKAVDPKFKINTPYGKVSSRKQQPEYKYDVDKFIEWAKDNNHDNLIRTRYDVDKAKTKKSFVISGDKLVDADTGEIVEGVTVASREDTISVTII